MTLLRLNLRPRRPIDTSLEAPEFVLLLGNFGQEDLSIPGHWFAGAIIEVTGPAGYVNHLQPFGPAPSFRPVDDEIFAESERARPFTLPGHLPPGAYRLTALLPLDPPLAADAEWYLEAPVACPLTVAGDEAWSLIPGVRQATLLRRRFAFGDVSSADAVFLSSPERVATGAPHAHSLVVSGGSERLAWLQGDDVAVFGATTVLFDSVEFRLPARAARLLSPILCDDDGSATFAALSKDNSTVWVFRAAAPVVRNSPASEAEEDEEEYFPPSAELSPPELLVSIALPFPARHLAIAAANSGVCLVAAAQVPEGVDLAIVQLSATGIPGPWNHVRVDRAALIDSCDPWVLAGQSHLAVSLLLRAGEGDDVHIALANFAFDSSLRPVWLDGVGRRRLAPGDPAWAALAPDPDGHWPRAWAAQTRAGRLFGGFLAPGALLRSAPAHFSEDGRFTLLVSTEDLAVALPHADGEPRTYRL